MSESTAERSRAGTARLNYEEKKQKQLEERRVLEPNHPLLEKFQKTLKEHLLHQIELMKNDIHDYETGAKKKNAQREELGVQVYDIQQIVNKRQCILDNYIEQIEIASVARKEHECILNERKEVHKNERQNLIKAEYEEIELKKEVEATNLLIYRVSKWENTVESDIWAKQRTFEKTRFEKLRLLKEKQLQDSLIYKRMVRTWELEAEIDKIDTQLRIVKLEREELAQTVALGNTNIEAISLDYRSLMNSWNSVIVSVRDRDKEVACLSAELNKLEMAFQNSFTEIAQVKKLCHKEMLKNEYLTLIKQRVSNGITTSQALLTEEIKKKASAERKINQLQAITQRTEEDIEKISIEIGLTNATDTDLLRYFENMTRSKAVIEEEILKKLEDRTMYDSTSNRIKEEVKETRKRREQSENALVLCENKTSSNVLQAQIQKTANEITQKVLDEVEEKVRKIQKQADAYNNENRQADALVMKRTKEIEVLNRRLSEIVDKTAGVLLSPVQVKISVFQRDISEFQAEIKELKKFWMADQAHLIFLSDKRQKQILAANDLQRRAMLMEVNNLRITDSLNQRQSAFDKITRDVNLLRNKLKILSEKMHGKQEMERIMGLDNDSVQQEYVNKLKDTQLECLGLSSEIEQIEGEKINLNDRLIELNREALEWEKKFILAKEAKSQCAQERENGDGGGTGRVENHKKEIRYGQLEKAQKKLMDDLETCIARREGFVNVARALEKRDGTKQVQYNVNRKLDDMRNKLKQMKNEIEAHQKRIADVQATYHSLEFSVQNIEREIEHNKSTLEFMNEELEESKSKQLLNFELILVLQKRLALFNEVRRGRKPYTVYKTESGMLREYEHQLDVNMKLSEIVDNLKNRFPNHCHQFTRMLNSLNLAVTFTTREKKKEE